MARALWLLPLLALAGCGGTPPPPTVDATARTASTLIADAPLSPASDVAISNVTAGDGTTASLHAKVSDSVDTSFVRVKSGFTTGHITFGFPTAPAGTLARVEILARTGNVGTTAASGTLRFDVLDGATQLGSVTQTLASVTTTSDSLAHVVTSRTVTEQSPLRVKVTLTHTAGAVKLARLSVNLVYRQPPAAVAGAMTRSGVPPASATYVRSAIVMLDWADLETSNQVFDWQPLRQAVSSVTSGTSVDNVKLRIMAGIAAPAFVKRANDGAGPQYVSAPATPEGAAVDCSVSTQGGVGGYYPAGAGCVPFFWSQAYMAQYRELMTALQDELLTNTTLYAGRTLDQLVTTVVDSACMTAYAEPFYRAQLKGYTHQRLANAGLSHQTDLDCHLRAIDVHREVFGTSRRTALAINKWDVVQPGCTVSSTADACRTQVWSNASPWGVRELLENHAKPRLTFGGELLLEVQNNGIGEVPTDRCTGTGTGLTSYFCYLRDDSGPRGVQTESWSNLNSSCSDLYLALDNAVAMNSHFAELPGGFGVCNSSILACYDEKLRDLQAGQPNACDCVSTPSCRQ
ncbi:hypothetical protein HPC49_43520 [Pyxidicoccus fallax]|uniref:Lipoprotein n=1 Tax=Pyxidicoccus fallax TaxID=394095 RepID=A0A848LQV0_9BACT|nr:hypothetical protein [Pyxidicoccus fallax]NMO19844.1 hypothetical protein [Pyxidicoccus fallax]NPC85075.1 hypothetical protein [Pyxidicoccus fallax]